MKIYAILSILLLASINHAMESDKTPNTHSAKIFQSIINQKGKLFILYGPSGAGKSTLATEMLKKLPQEFTLEPVINYTCRLPRAYEINGKDYHFITEEEFLKKQNSDFFIHTTSFLNKMYGCPKSIVGDLDSGKNLIVSLDRDGAKTMAQVINNSVLIYISAPLEELSTRLLKRNSETDEQQADRLEHAKKEVTEEMNSNLYHYHLVNNDFEQSLDELIFLITDTLHAHYQTKENILGKL